MSLVLLNELPTCKRIIKQLDHEFSLAKRIAYLLRNIKIRNHPTWRLKEIENNWDWEGFEILLFLEDKSAFVHLPGQRVSDRKAIEKSSSTKKFREHQMEILYLGGFKQTVYFDTGRLQGYPLCEIDFF